jgi:hypothetical protein
VSVQAYAWVLEDAPDLKPHLVATLLGLANHADRDGKGTYASVPTLMHYTRKTSARAVRNDLVELEGSGLIRRGNQAMVMHLPPDRRPVVWDLAMERRREEPLPVLKPSGRPASLRRKGTPDRGEVECTPENALVGPGCSTVPDRGEVQFHGDQAKQPPGCSTLHPNQPSFEPSLRTVPPQAVPPAPASPVVADSGGTEFSPPEPETPDLALAAAGVLDTVSRHYRLRLGTKTRQRFMPQVMAHLARGWRPEDLSRHLLLDLPPAIGNPGGLLSHRLSDVPDPAPRPTAPGRDRHLALIAERQAQEAGSVKGKPSTARETARALAVAATMRPRTQRGRIRAAQSVVRVDT